MIGWGRGKGSRRGPAARAESTLALEDDSSVWSLDAVRVFWTQPPAPPERSRRARDRGRSPGADGDAPAVDAQV